MIENSDRGITLNKALAWTMASGLIAAGLYVGLQVATLSTRIDEASRASLAATGERQQIEVRVRSLEQSKARDDERFAHILAMLSRIDSRLERIERGRGE
ncbi:hypothetical protein JAO82_00325 [Pontibaca sp. S1109L]|uniref:Uncharacterized protein n=2 Tax=Pontibaca salina TaxID=2795731 RepID=A0A934HQH2_9RHOB|nr:hypothetical protein [Pontibaca salina]